MFFIISATSCLICLEIRSTRVQVPKTKNLIPTIESLNEMHLFFLYSYKYLSCVSVLFSTKYLQVYKKHRVQFTTHERTTSREIKKSKNVFLLCVEIVLY